MAELNYPGILKAGDGSGILTTADYIAYDYLQNDDGFGGKDYQMNKSLKDKIDEISANIPEDLAGSIESINQLVQQALGYANNSRSYSVEASAANLNALAAKEAINNTKTEIENTIRETKEDIQYVKSIALNFSGVIDSASEFAIVTESDYNKMKNGLDGMSLSPHTIYFCYDPNLSLS